MALPSCYKARQALDPHVIGATPYHCGTRVADSAGVAALALLMHAGFQDTDICQVQSGEVADLGPDAHPKKHKKTSKNKNTIASK